MKDSKYLIIGNGIAGDSAAEQVRINDTEGSITILTADTEPVYNRITLKTYMKGKMPKKFTKIHDREWYNDKDIDLKLETEVIDVDTEEKIVSTHSGEKYGYENLLVATGGRKKKLPEDPGLTNTHYMWDWEDADRIKESAEENEKAVVIGGGLLGIDLAVIFAEHGCNVEYLIRGGYWWRKGISEKGATLIHEKLEKKGVNVVTNCEVDEIKSESGEATEVVGSNGERYPCDTVGIAIGRHPNFEFVDAEKTGSDSLKTDSHLQTSAEDVYAAGDLVNYYSPLFEKRREGGTWDHSAAMGQTAGKNLAGNEEEFYFVPSYGIGHFDVQVLSLGENYGDSITKRSGDTYMELCFEDDRLIGAVLIGEVSPKDRIEDAIKDKEEFDDREEALKLFWKNR